MTLRLITNPVSDDIRDLCHLMSLPKHQARERVLQLDPATLQRYKQVVSEIEVALQRGVAQCP